MRLKSLPIQLILALAAWTLAACGRAAATPTLQASPTTSKPVVIATPSSTATNAPTPASAPILRVFADEALNRGFTQLAQAFRNLNPDVEVELAFAPSADLLARSQQGDPADVVAVAGDAVLDDFVAAGLIVPAQAVLFTEDRLAVVVPFGASARDLAVLAEPGLRLALAREGTPLGAASRLALAQLAVAPPEGVPLSLDSLLGAARIYDDASAIIEALQGGEVDAAILYGSAVTPLLEDELRRIHLPDAASQPLPYTIAPLRTAAQPDLAGQFIELVTSTAGLAAVSAYNLYPAVSLTLDLSEAYPSLEIIGSVDWPLALSADELAQRPQIEVEVLDRQGDLRSYRGVSLKALLEEARPQPGVQMVFLRASDDYLAAVPLEFVMTCDDCVITTHDDGSLQAILPGYDPAAWVRLLVQIDVE